MRAACPRCGLENTGGDRDLCPKCLLTGALPPVAVGENLELQDEIGAGGMGTVFRARHTRLDRTVAVKFLPPELQERPRFEARFEREARAMARLDHPNIVTVHDFGVHEGQSYIVMEYVNGLPASDCLPVEPQRALEIAIQVTDALAYAHARGVIHCDIKPENVLLEADNRVKVVDFGISRVVREDPSVATTHLAMGTPYYVAPEVLAGGVPDERADVYAVGVLLYHLIQGAVPAGQFEPLHPALDEIVRGALAADPDKRTGTATELRRRLDGARRGLGAAPAIDAAASLPLGEQGLTRAVALLLAAGTSVVLWAVLLSVTPRLVAPGEVHPMGILGAEKLADGRLISWARFETWPTFGAVAAAGLALLAYALLRRHWRLHGLERDEPHAPVREALYVLITGIVACVVYATRLGLDSAGLSRATVYVSFIGPAIILTGLYLAWVTTLGCLRINRPLRREPRLWVGFLLTLVPPVSDFIVLITTWTPE